MSPEGKSTSDVKAASPRPGLAERARAFGVHIFTACGAALGLLALIAAVRGDWPWMFWWLGAALFVDGIDGSFAHRHAQGVEIVFFETGPAGHAKYRTLRLVHALQSGIEQRFHGLDLAALVFCHSAQVTLLGSILDVA